MAVIAKTLDRRRSWRYASSLLFDRALVPSAYVPAPELGPTLRCELNPAVWIAAGYEANNTKSYLDEVWQSRVVWPYKLHIPFLYTVCMVQRVTFLVMTSNPSFTSPPFLASSGGPLFTGLRRLHYLSRSTRVPCPCCCSLNPAVSADVRGPKHLFRDALPWSVPAAVSPSPLGRGAGGLLRRVARRPAALKAPIWRHAGLVNSFPRHGAAARVWVMLRVGVA